MDAGEAVVSVLPAEGKHVAVRAAVRTVAAPSQLIAWARKVEALHAGPYVQAIGRFSDPPRIEDLDSLQLDDADVLLLRRCRPGNCGVKLSDVEIAAMREAIGRAGSDWKQEAQHTFRRIVLERTQRYLAEGHGLSAVYNDERKRTALDAEFAALAAEVALAQPRLFPLTNYLSLYPSDRTFEAESLLYWSKESLGAKPIVSVTHAAMLSNGGPTPEAIVAKKQVYASHYILASLSFTAISTAPGGAGHYLVYLNHTRSDVLDGLFGGFIRRVIEKRLRAEGPKALDALRQRLENGEPN